MKVSLNTPERILLASSLPSENDFVTLKIVRKIKDHVGFSEEELKTLELKSELVGNGQTRFAWNTSKDFQREFEFGEKAVEIIVGLLNDLGNQKKATIQHLELLEKFAPKE
jgi:hypothetical protein